MDEADEQGAKVVVFPELCLTGYTCGDLFGQAILLKAVKEGLKELTEYTKEKDGLYFVIFSSKMFLCRENNYAVNFKKCKVSPVNLLNFYIYLIKMLFIFNGCNDIL